MTEPPAIRPATPADAADCQSIYAHHVLHGTGSFDHLAPTVEGFAARLTAVLGAGWPWLVATDVTGVLGYAYAAPLRDRAAYRFTAEDSVYVRQGLGRRGVGRALLAALIEAAAQAGYRQMVAVIGDSANAGSIGLHAAFGFRQVGVWEGVGFKHGRWLDVVHMQRSIP